MDRILYIETKWLAENIKEVTVLYETDHKLYVSYRKEAPTNGVRLRREATLLDHAKYTLAVVEQKQNMFAH